MSEPSLQLEVRPAGLYLPALDLYLDPEREVARAFVSHAHGDHGAGWSSGSVFASHETLSLLTARRGPLPGARVMEWDGAIEMAVAGGTARVSIAPAGHVLGAAQLVVDHPRGRFVYTGDYRTGPGATHAEGAPIECDTLAIESTFGLPIFSFPDRAATLEAIVAWCRRVMGRGETPVLLGYPLGKSQVLTRALVDAGLEVVLHGAAYKMSVAYEALGVELGIAAGAVRAYAEEKKRLAGVLIAPPRAAATPMIKGRKGVRVGYVSGWAVVDAAVERVRAEAAFALSDHADFDDLLDTVAASRAGFVYTTHGEAAVLSRILAERGIASAPREVTAIDEREEAIE